MKHETKKGDVASGSEQNMASASRRKFLKGGLAAAVGSAAVGFPMISVGAPLVLKMQTSWPSSDIWMDFARQYTERVERMSGDRLKIDLLPAGAVVGPSGHGRG